MSICWSAERGLAFDLSARCPLETGRVVAQRPAPNDRRRRDVPARLPGTVTMQASPPTCCPASPTGRTLSQRRAQRWWMIFKANPPGNFAQGDMAMFSTYGELAMNQAGVLTGGRVRGHAGVLVVIGLAIQRLLLRAGSAGCRRQRASRGGRVHRYVHHLQRHCADSVRLHAQGVPDPFDPHAWYG